MVGVLLGYLLGVLHGMRHAFEPDHVAAVTTLIAEQRSARTSLRFAVAWGTGHAITLLLVGGVLFAFRRAMPPRVVDGFELVVAIMLVFLGLRSLVAAARSEVGEREPTDAAHAHAVAHRHAHAHARRREPLFGGWARARRPLFVGLVHGLAGSGALAAMVMAELPSLAAGLAFMALYGLGATCGMAALAGLAGVPLARMARMPRVVPAVMMAAGIFSIALGAVWAAPLVGRLLAA